MTYLGRVQQMPGDMNDIGRREFLHRLGAGLGVVLAPGTVAAVLSGCRPDAAASPEFLTAVEYLLVGDLAERIIPRTDTPGALDAGVPAYIDMLLAHFSDDATRAEVRGQLGALQAWLSEHQADRIDHLDPAVASALVESLDAQALPQGASASARDPAPPDPSRSGTPPTVELNLGGDTPLFRRLKPWTVAGYYTSQLGALEELHQPPMGAYNGDIPYTEVGKTWA